MCKILMLDNDPDSLQKRTAMLTGLNYQIEQTRSIDDAFQKIGKFQPTIIIIDINAYNKLITDHVASLSKLAPLSPIIVIANSQKLNYAIQTLAGCTHSIIQSPTSAMELNAYLKTAMAYQSLLVENQRLKKQLTNPASQEIYKNHDITGKSSAITSVLKRALKIAPSDASVIILGESGTGKELMARAIHNNSKRKNKPFIALDCVALPSSLLESELFGFEQGAFTGAEKSKPGMIELADEGTLFLDEVVELDINLQAKLLRVIQERQIRRIGGIRLIDVNIRIISATNWNLEEAVRQNKLREDLYYRLNVVPINMPPLRERLEDLPSLIQNFINDFSLRTAKSVNGISTGALKTLGRYHWPGNIRELQNVIEQMVVLATSETLDEEDIPPFIIENTIPRFKSQLYDLDFKTAKEKHIAEFYEHYFGYLLRKHNGNISQVSRKAQISRKNIYQIIKNFQIKY